MSSVSTSRPKKVDPLSKKVPENPKYKNVKATVDTGASLTKYMERIEDIRMNYKHKQGEIFKRMKVTTFVQLVMQVLEYEQSQTPRDNGSYRPDTADDEVDWIQRGGGDRSPAPSLAVTEGDYGAPANGHGTNRSTLQGVIKGQGELDRNLQEPPKQADVQKLALDGCPYLILDVREKDKYDECHIISAKSYPSAMLSRACNYESPEMLLFKNKPGKIIVMYDETETLAPNCATTIIQRGYDNVFLLSGGMKVAYKIFPEGLMTGTPPQIVTEATRPPSKLERAGRNVFTQDDIDKINIYLDNALTDKSSGSRLSKASTTSSRMSNFSSSQMSKQGSVASGRVSHRTAFK